MPRVPLIATKAFVYATRSVQPDEAFEALTASDARILLAVGHARPGAPADSTDADVRPSRRGRYKRRDLVAEE